MNLNTMGNHGHDQSPTKGASDVKMKDLLGRIGRRSCMAWPLFLLVTWTISFKGEPLWLIADCFLVVCSLWRGAEMERIQGHSHHVTIERFLLLGHTVLLGAEAGIFVAEQLW